MKYLPDKLISSSPRKVSRSFSFSIWTRLLLIVWGTRTRIDHLILDWISFYSLVGLWKPVSILDLTLMKCYDWLINIMKLQFLLQVINGMQMLFLITWTQVRTSSNTASTETAASKLKTMFTSRIWELLRMLVWKIWCLLITPSIVLAHNWVTASLLLHSKKTNPIRKCFSSKDSLSEKMFATVKT